MTERRALIEGIKAKAAPADSAKEEQFVFGGKKKPQVEREGERASPTTAATHHARIPLSTRMRADFSAALKRASLERQLEGVEPNTLTEILEQAVEPWLRNNGYLN
jgi:hypothetical protein